MTRAEFVVPKSLLLLSRARAHAYVHTGGKKDVEGWGQPEGGSTSEGGRIDKK